MITEVDQDAELEIPRCILIEKVPQDVTSLKEHGDIEYLFQPNTSRPSIYDAQSFSRELADELALMDYDPQIDFIVIVGGMIPIAEICALVGRKYGAFKALVFDAKDSRYHKCILGESNAKKASSAGGEATSISGRDLSAKPGNRESGRTGGRLH